jgi:hypothetical protein
MPRVLAALLLIAGLWGCGGPQAKLSPEQERFAKDTEASFSTVKSSVEAAIAASKPSAGSSGQAALASLEGTLAQAQQKVAALRQGAGTWEERKSAVEAALKELQLKVTETVEKVPMPRASGPGGG